MAIGEIILAAFLEVLFEKLASGLLANFAQEEVLDTQLKKLSKTLLIIQAVIDDAEEKQITDRAVKMWLEDLNDVAYDLDDLLDEFATESLRRNLMDQKRRHASTSKVRKLIPTCCTRFSPGAFMFDRHMRSKIEQINARLQDIAAQKNDLGLEKNAGAVRERLPQPAWANKSDVYGREKDKEAVLDLLLRDHASDDGLCVIPIVGMAGVGKTTLAQLVYDDDSLESHFALKAWAYVSHDFDAFKVAKTVLESVTSVAWNFEDQNMLMNELKESLSGKMFLVVLDDIWNENPIECDNLLCPFLVGAPGSKIIITTRNDNVASMMRTVPALYLKKLNDDDCLSLFAQNALQRRNFDAHPDLKEVGEKIVKKCDGLPLAAKTLGGLLRKELCQYEWENILNSKIWELSPGRSGILPALRLSYHHLSSHLKQCFAYCSIFPKGYEFDKEEVILLWMAEGLLQLSKGKKRMMEDFGRDCFNGLLSMSFFQQSSGNKTKFVMHDLVNDLAQFVAGEICFRLLDKFEDNEQCTIPKCARHLSYTRESYEAFQKFNALCEVKHLRTFLPFHVHGSCSWPTSYLTNRVLFDLLPKLHCLRVLSLSGYHINRLPDSIDNLKYLRYLNLSYTSIKWLPQSLGTLYNLETLLLRGCDCLCMLPSNIVNLINMHHLDNSDTKLLQEMPLGIGSLTNLQTLSKLIVGKGKGSRLSELKNLLHLRGMLSIVNLQNIMDVREAKEANLMDKPDLDELQLSWCREFDDSRNKKLEMDVLDMLKPHRNLKMLKVEFFGGMTFPSWIGDLSFSKMVNVNLIGCTKCNVYHHLGN